MATKVCFECFWPGFKPASDKIFGAFFQDNFDFEYVEAIEDADVAILSWNTNNLARIPFYERLKSRANCPFVYYTAEHDGAGLNGIDQVNFDIFDYVISHYDIDDDRHLWMPNYVRRHGLNVFSMTNALYEQNRQKQKPKNIQFCYSNATCEPRNQAFHALNNLTPIDCGGKLFNTGLEFLPREHHIYIDRLAEYKFIFAYENAQFPGYNTEKIVHALMAGSVPLYWGDPNIEKVWNPRSFINLNTQDMNQVFLDLAREPKSFHAGFALNAEIPFKNAEKFETTLYMQYREFFGRFI